MTTHTHPAEGRLRRLLDEPLLVPDRQRFHVERCDRCRSRLALLGDDRELVGRKLLRSTGQPQLSPAQARARLETAVRDEPAGHSARRRSLPALPSLLGAKRGLAAALGAVVIVAGTVTATAAAGWITIFQPTQVAAVPIPQGALLALPDLREFGEISSSSLPQLRLASSLGAAEAESGQRLLLPATPPPGSSGSPRFAVVPTWSATFTFDAGTARATAARLGVALPPVPSGFDGAKLKETVGPAVLAAYPSGKGASLADLPQAAYLSMAAPRLQSTGLTVSELERYLLSIPWLPSGLASALRTLGDPATTLPIPVPERMGQAVDTTVGGDRAVLVSGSGAGVRQCRQSSSAAGASKSKPSCHGLSGGYAAVVWEHLGTVHAIFAQLPAAQVLKLARAGG